MRRSQQAVDLCRRRWRHIVFGQRPRRASQLLSTWNANYKHTYTLSFTHC